MRILLKHEIDEPLPEHQEGTHEEGKSAPDHEDEENDHAVGLDPVELLARAPGEEPPQDAPAVKRRNRDEIEAMSMRLTEIPAEQTDSTNLS